MKQNIITTGLATSVVLAALSLSGCTTATQIPESIKVESVNPTDNVITVTGQEDVKVVPDIAQITYSVYTRAEDAASCQEQNSTDLAAAIETLKSLGLAETSIQTSSYGLSPIHDWNSGTQEVVGYEMNTVITVSDVPISDAGAVISQSIRAGVNQIESVNYFSSNYDAGYQDALKGAMAVAQAKAEALADASGRELGGVVHVEETGYNPDTRYSAYRNAANESLSSAAAADIAVMPGQVSVEARVTVSYRLAGN